MARRIRRRSFDEEVRGLEKLLGQYDDEFVEEDEIDEVLTQDELLEDELLEDELLEDELLEDELLEDELDVEMEAEDDVLFVDDEEVLMEEEDLEGIYSSEDEPGVEDEITQGYLDEVEKEEGKGDVSTEPSVKEAKLSRFKEASRRLDRVANYFEKSGRKDLALRIDKLSTSLDRETKNLASLRK